MANSEGSQRIVEIIERAFKVAEDNYSDQGAFTKDTFLLLGSIFGNGHLESALELLEKEPVTEVESSSSKRTLFRVRGSSGICYTLPSPLINRCSCLSWSKRVWRGDDWLCKHMLVVLIVKKIAPNMVVKRVVSEDAFVDMISNME